MAECAAWHFEWFEVNSKEALKVWTCEWNFPFFLWGVNILFIPFVLTSLEFWSQFWLWLLFPPERAHPLFWSLKQTRLLFSPQLFCHHFLFILVFYVTLFPLFCFFLLLLAKCLQWLILYFAIELLCEVSFKEALMVLTCEWSFGLKFDCDCCFHPSRLIPYYDLWNNHNCCFHPNFKDRWLSPFCFESFVFLGPRMHSLWILQLGQMNM